MEELRDYLHMIIDDLHVQIDAAQERQDVEAHIYLRGHKQGIAIALEKIAQLEAQENE